MCSGLATRKRCVLSAVLAESIPASCRDLGLCFPTNQPQHTVLERQLNCAPKTTQECLNLHETLCSTPLWEAGRNTLERRVPGIKEHLAGWGAAWSWGTFWPLCALLMPVDLPSPREGKGRGKAPGQQEGWMCCCADVLLPKTTLINSGSQNGGVINN